MTTKIYPTLYVGIHRQCQTMDNGSKHWWIFDDNQNEEYYGPSTPSTDEVKKYKETRYEGVNNE